MAITTSPATLTYTVTDHNGSTDSDTLTLTVAAAGGAELTRTDQTYTMGQMIPCPDPASCHRRYRHADLHPDRAERRCGFELERGPAGLMWTG